MRLKILGCPCQEETVQETIIHLIGQPKSFYFCMLFFFFLFLKLVLLRNHAQIISKNRDPLTRYFKYENNETIFDWFIFVLHLE